MRTAHQGVPVASLPNAQRGGFMSNLFQTASQASAAPQPAPMPPGSGGYRPPPARTSAPPPNPSARPEAAAGLDGWLVDRLFGR
jgi:penicillin-binding protein 1A